jgi:hypothetical protein
MTIPDLPTLRRLVVEAQQPCLSIYVPTHRSGPEVQQDAIRFEKALREGERLLRAAGADPDAMLGSVRLLRDDAEFWAHQSDGLAVFCDGREPTIHRVPITVEETVRLGDRPYLKPLLPLVSKGGARYRVLALSQQSVRLFEGSAEGLAPVTVPDLPQSVDDVVGDTRRGGLQQHSEGPSGVGIVHGQASTADIAKAELEKFVRAIDGALHSALSSRPLPLVIAAVDHVASAFRQVARADDAHTLSGNPDQLGAADLHERAWPLVAPSFDRERERVLETVRRGLGTGKVVQRIDEVVLAAYEGRVDTMLVAYDVSRWGYFDRKTKAVSIHDERNPRDHDLIDCAAIDCMLHGGTLHALRYEDMPGDDAKAIAVLRW